MFANADNMYFRVFHALIRGLKGWLLLPFDFWSIDSFDIVFLVSCIPFTILRPAELRPQSQATGHDE